jgi:hypothetical protein
MSVITYLREKKLANLNYDVADDEKLTFEDYSEIFNYLSKNDGNLYGSIAKSTDSKII